MFTLWQWGQHINWKDLEHDAQLTDCPSTDIVGFGQVLDEEQWGQNICCKRAEQEAQLKNRPCLYSLLFHVLFLWQTRQTSVVVIA